MVPLAVSGARRATAAPDVQTLGELGYKGFDDLFVANSLPAPTGTSPAMIKALNREVVRLNTVGPIGDKLIEASYEPGMMSPEDYGAMIERELKLGRGGRGDRRSHQDVEGEWRIASGESAVLGTPPWRGLPFLSPNRRARTAKWIE